MLDPPATLAALVRSKIQKLVCQVITPVVKAAYEQSDEGLPIKTNQLLKDASKRILQRCPLANLSDAVKLMEALDQLALFSQLLTCLKWLQSKESCSNLEVICRALLIVAYSIYELPKDGL